MADNQINLDLLRHDSEHFDKNKGKLCRCVLCGLSWFHSPEKQADFKREKIELQSVCLACELRPSPEAELMDLPVAENYTQSAMYFPGTVDFGAVKG